MPYAVISASSTDNTLVAANANARIRVHSLFIVATAALTATFKDGTGGTAITGAMPLAANGGVVLPYNPEGWFITSKNTLLSLNLSTSSAFGGLTYSLAPKQ